MADITGMAELSVSHYVQEAWETVVRVCNRVLHDAEVYGFQFMHMPNPSAEKMYQHLVIVVIPVLESLLELDYDPDDGRLLINTQQHLLHLRMIVTAIRNKDQEAFEAAIDALGNENFF